MCFKCGLCGQRVRKQGPSFDSLLELLKHIEQRHQGLKVQRQEQKITQLRQQAARFGL